MMFVFVAVSDKIFTLIIPFEMSQNLITHVFEIRVVRKIIATAHFDGSNSLFLQSELCSSHEQRQ